TFLLQPSQNPCTSRRCSIELHQTRCLESTCVRLALRSAPPSTMSPDCGVLFQEVLNPHQGLRQKRCGVREVGATALGQNRHRGRHRTATTGSFSPSTPNALRPCSKQPAHREETLDRETLRARQPLLVERDAKSLEPVEARPNRDEPAKDGTTPVSV